MRRTWMTFALAALALTILPGRAAAQDPMVGDWDVTVAVMGQELPLVLHLTQGEKGLEGTFDSPAQGAMGLPVLAVNHEHPKLRIELETGGAPAVLEGTHEGDAIEGAFSQGPATGTFKGKKQAAKADAKPAAAPGGGA